MDPLSFIHGMTSALAWPLVVLIVAFALRKQIVKLIPTIRELTIPGGFVAKFEMGLDSVEQRLRVIKSVRTQDSAPEQSSLSASLDVQPASEVDEVAVQYQPTGFVMESWKEVEAAARSLLSTKNQLAALTLSLSEVFIYLGRNELLTPQDIQIIDELRKLRDMVAHAPQVWITPSHAERFKLLSSKLIRRLKIKKSIEYVTP